MSVATGITIDETNDSCQGFKVSKWTEQFNVKPNSIRYYQYDTGPYTDNILLYIAIYSDSQAI